MARTIDLSSKLTTERPTITLNGKSYQVNDEKTNVLLMNQELKKADTNDVDIINKVITILLGKKALKDIETAGYGISQYITIFYALIAAINDISMEEAEQRFQGRQHP